MSLITDDLHCDRQGCLADGKNLKEYPNGVFRLVCVLHGYEFNLECENAGVYPGFLNRHPGTTQEMLDAWGRGN